MKSLKTKLPPDLVPAKPSKYRNVRTRYNGVVYASKAEADRAVYLDSLISGGIIRFWIPQPKFRLGCPENVFVGDFLVVSVGVDIRVEDVKGMETKKFTRDRKLWEAYGPCDLWIVKKTGIEIVTPKPRKY